MKKSGSSGHYGPGGLSALAPVPFAFAGAGGRLPRNVRVPVWTAPRFAAALGIDVKVQFP